MPTSSSTGAAAGQDAAPRAGRPLDPRRDEAILAAALELLGEVGYDQVSMDAIAGRAGVSKATIYRRWDSKATLVVDAIKSRHKDQPTIVDTGDVRSDLLTGLRAMTTSIYEQDLGLMGGMLCAMRSDAELARLMREQMINGKREASRAWTKRCITRGQLPPDTDDDLLHEIAPAMVLMRLMVTSEPVGDEFIVHIVDDILLPLLTRHCGADPSPTTTRTSE